MSDNDALLSCLRRSPMLDDQCSMDDFTDTDEAVYGAIESVYDKPVPLLAVAGLARVSIWRAFWTLRRLHHQGHLTATPRGWETARYEHGVHVWSE